MLTINLELEKAIEKINQENAKLVCMQLPDGLKPRAEEIQSKVEEKTQAKVVFWFGTCLGACDLPIGLDKLGVDLIIQFGHSDWNPKLSGYEYR